MLNKCTFYVYFSRTTEDYAWDCSNSITNVLELLQSCTNPSYCALKVPSGHCCFNLMRWILLKEHKHVFALYVFPQLWYCIGSWDPSLSKSSSFVIRPKISIVSHSFMWIAIIHPVLILITVQFFKIWPFLNNPNSFFLDVITFPCRKFNAHLTNLWLNLDSWMSPKYTENVYPSLHWMHPVKQVSQLPAHNKTGR